MIENPAVSVIVPVYDCKDTLEECLDSLLAQTLQSLEIVVVNDGSPDNEQEVIDEYVRRHPDKIVSFVKENGGLPHARNYGVERSRGRYIGYVDSDDFVEPDMYELLLEAAERQNCDIAIGKYIHYGLDGRTSVNGKLPQAEHTVFPGYEFLLSQRSMVVWNKLYRRELVERFPQPITWFEDVAWTPVVMTHTDRVCFVDKALYHYVRREGSIASSHEDPRTLEGIRSLLYAIENAAPEHRDAAEFMGVRRLLFESKIRTPYADRYLAALRDLTDDLEGNKYLREDDFVRADAAPYIGDAPIIPKRIIWWNFGGAELSDQVRQCLESWPERLVYSDAEIIELNESNCDVNSVPGLRQLHDDGEFEVIGQYFALAEIAANGGIALDRHLRANGFIAPLLLTSAFVSYGMQERLAFRALGAVPGHRLIDLILSQMTQLIAAEHCEPNSINRILNEVVSNEFGARLDGRSESLASLQVHAASIFAQNVSASNITEVTFPDDQTAISGDITTGRYADAYVEQLRDRVTTLENRQQWLEGQLNKSKRTVKNITSSNRWRVTSKLKRIDSSSTIKTALRLRTVLKQRTRDELFILRDGYVKVMDSSPVENDLALFESFYGRGMISNPFAIFRAWTLRSDFESMRFVWALDDLAAHEELISESTTRWPNISFVERGSPEYLSTLARAKFLVNDVTFYFDFVKRLEQVYVNTWHSITVKSLGFDVPGRRLDQKNVVRNMLACDFFLAANDFVKDDMVLRSHMMDGLMPGRVIVEGHPRNDLTFATERDDVVAEMQAAGVNLDPDKPTIVFAPTWRGEKISAPTDDLDGYLDVLQRIDASLGAGTHNVLIRLHQLSHAALRLRHELQRVAVPPTIDANRMFAATDLLVTDYSSIFFDFMVTKRPIAFYWPDVEEYERSRGLYFTPDDLPGPTYTDVDSLVAGITNREMERDEWKQRYEEITAWVCPNDDGHVSERVLDVVLDGSTSDRVHGPYDTQKPRILLFAGSLSGGRLAAKLHNIVGIMGTEQFDLTVLVDDSGDGKVQWNVAKLLDSGVRVIGRSQYTSFSFAERAAFAIDNEAKHASVPNRVLAGALAREWRRCFGDAGFDALINLDQGSLFFASLLVEAPVPLKFAWVDGDPVPAKASRQKRLHRRQASTHTMLTTNQDFEGLRSRLSLTARSEG